MIDKGKREVVGVKVNVIDYEATVDRVRNAAEKQESLSVSALAVHGVMTGALDRNHRYRLNRIDLVVPDGQPVRWALNLLYGVGLPDRVYGPNLMLYICEMSTKRKLPIFLYGSTRSVLDALVVNLRAKFPRLNIAGTQPSQFGRLTDEKNKELMTTISESGAKVTFVGLGCPRQEVWIYENKDDLSMPILAVGAAFDFHANAVPQAPQVMQAYGLEWLFRLSQEPARLWKRYLVLNPAYLVLLGLQFMKLPLAKSSDEAPPAEPLRYG